MILTFTIFQHGCTNCRFSFCSKCVNQKATVPRIGDSKLYPVCPGCYQLLTNQQKSIPNMVKSTIHNVPSPNLPPDPLLPPSMRTIQQGYSNPPVSCRTDQMTVTEERGDKELADRQSEIYFMFHLGCLN